MNVAEGEDVYKDVLAEVGDRQHQERNAMLASAGEHWRTLDRIRYISDAINSGFPNPMGISDLPNSLLSHLGICSVSVIRHIKAFSTVPNTIYNVANSKQSRYF